MQLKRSKKEKIISAIMIIIVAVNLLMFIFLIACHIKAEIEYQNWLSESARYDVGYDVLSKQYPRLTPYLWEIITTEGKKNGIDPATICAIIDQESSFRRCAVSPAGAKGYMQLMPSTAKMLRITDSFDSHQNIKGGISHYAMCLKKANGDQKLALRMFNGGCNKKKYALESIRYSELCINRINKSVMLAVSL